MPIGANAHLAMFHYAVRIRTGQYSLYFLQHRREGETGKNANLQCCRPSPSPARLQEPAAREAGARTHQVGPHGKGQLDTDTEQTNGQSES